MFKQIVSEAIQLPLNVDVIMILENEEHRFFKFKDSLVAII